MERCYFDDIPDSVSDRLMDSGRVPSYKAIAIAILNNDLTMRSLGFSIKITPWFYILKNDKSENIQNNLF